MSGFASGLGFLILSCVLLFAWLAVAVFVSSTLAFGIGLGIVGIWAVFFLPSGVIREVMWQGRQKKIMQQAISQSPSYQAGSALPPPMQGQALSVVNQPGGGAIDLYHDLPQLLPQLEPRPHGLSFKRSLVLPVLGILMMIGSSNDALMQKLLERSGTMHAAGVQDELVLAPAYAGKRHEMEQAARMILRRETDCGKILSGELAPLVQFRPAAEQAAQIEAGDYVYEFSCQPNLKDAKPFMAFISKSEIDRGSFASLFSTLSHHVSDVDALTACQTAGNKALEALNASIDPMGPVGLPANEAKAQVKPARMPYGDYVRVVSTEGLLRAGVAGGNVGMSCWVDSQGHANVRFLKAN